MDYVITFTPPQLIGAILAICAGVTCISGAMNVIINVINRAKAPEMKQNERITTLEDKVAEHERLLNHSKERLGSLEEGNIITQRAMLALLAHGIDGNAFDEMRKAKQELQEYLLRK